MRQQCRRRRARRHSERATSPRSSATAPEPRKGTADRATKKHIKHKYFFCALCDFLWRHSSVLFCGRARLPAMPRPIKLLATLLFASLLLSSVAFAQQDDEER